ncbi:MAG: cation acetate symporter [Robiginitomaculum sp.]|nr:MAG: cation acetate symporter [Robiginitomaculum sp.]
MNDIQIWTWSFVILSFSLYIGIAIWARASTTGEFYVAGQGIPPLLNGMATAADWMSAASFISMAGIIAFVGYDGSVYLMGWTGGYVLLALLLAPYLRKFGKFTVPDFIGDRYYSNLARVVAVICAIFISFTYIAGQMRGVGIVFSRFLEIDVELGVMIGMLIVFFYAVLGGMKGITYTQIAQFCVLIFAYLVPAIFISLMVTNTPIPQLGLIGNTGGEPLLTKLDGLTRELGFTPYLAGKKSMIDMTAITLALMVGTAGLPHVIIRFFTVPKVSDARISAGWALLFIALLYTTAPAVAAFARLNFIESVNGSVYEASDETATPEWFKTWENTGLLSWDDKNNNGKLDYHGGPENEVNVNRDIMVLANPEIANLPPWVVALVAAGGLAAALSTAAGLLLVISSSISHDLAKRVLFKDLSDKNELLIARLAAIAAIAAAGYLGINPPGFVAQVVAFAFGLAAASFFPVIVLGIFTKFANKWGAVIGMLGGIGFTMSYIIWFKFIHPEANLPENWLWGISPEGIGVVGMMINFGLVLVISHLTAPPPPDVIAMIEDVRQPE